MKPKNLKPVPDPDKLLDFIIETLELKNDSALSRVLHVSRPTISKIRHRKVRIGPEVLLSMHEVTGLSIAELKSKLNE